MVFRKKLREQTELAAASRPMSGMRASLSSPPCLVASVNPTQQERLAECAAAAGWQPVVCASVESAMAAVRRTLFRLALVDLNEPWQEDASEFRDLAEHLRQQAELLLVLCGNLDSASEEIWARQLGAWMYLPGSVSEDDMRSICREAVTIAGKLAVSPAPAVS